MSDLIPKLLATIEKTERLAESAGEHDDNWEYRRAPGVTITDREGESSSPDGGISWHPGTGMAIYTHWEEDGEHIVQHSPSRVLRRCAADRRMVEYLAQLEDGPHHPEVYEVQGHILRGLAEGYGITEGERP